MLEKASLTSGGQTSPTIVRSLSSSTQKTLVAGDSYAAVEGLAQRLHLLGDLPQSAFANIKSGIYDGALVDAVKRFRSRHGLGADGKLDKKTVQQLNVPLNFRVHQLEDALERWRWLPADFSPLPVAVNIPEFVLRVFSADHRIALRMILKTIPRKKPARELFDPGRSIKK